MIAKTLVTRHVESEVQSVMEENLKNMRTALWVLSLLWFIVSAVGLALLGYVQDEVSVSAPDFDFTKLTNFSWISLLLSMLSLVIVALVVRKSKCVSEREAQYT